MRGERAQPRQRLAGAVGERAGGIFGEADHPAVGDVRLEAKAVRDRRRNENRGRRGKRQLRRIERHLAAAALDQQDLKQVAMAVGADGPVVDRRARRDGFDVNEVERLIVRRIAVKMKQRQRAGTWRQHRPIAPEKKPAAASRSRALHKKSGSPRLNRAAAVRNEDR